MAEDIKNKGQNIGEDKQLPSVSHSYSKSETSTDKGKSPRSGRISTALVKNTTSTVSSLEKEYKDSIENIVETGSLDKEGNLIKLDTMATKTLFSLSKQIFESDNEDVNKYLELAESESKKPANERNEEALKKTPEVPIDFISVSIDLYGKKEGSKPSQIIKTYKFIKKISEIKIPQIINTGKFTEKIGEEKIEHIGIVQLLEPYISIGSEEQYTYIRKKKDKDDNTTDEQKISIITSANIKASRIFYENNWLGKGSKHFPLLEGILDARLPSGRAITTDIYWIAIFPMAAQYRYHAYSINYQQTLKKIKDENIIDSEKIARLKEDALTCANISINKVREILGFETQLKETIDKHKEKKKKEKKEVSEKTISSIIRVYKRRFKEQLWDAMWALIDRGIITEKSSIDWKKDTLTFVFTEKKEPEPLNTPGTRKEYEVKPKGFWEKNPFRS